GIYAGFDTVKFFTTATDRMVITTNGDVGIGTPSPSAILDVNGATGYDQLRLRTAYTPTGSADANGNIGDIAWDDGFIYVKTSAGWKRSSLVAF
ncbi:MAG: hypothetical protein KAT05_05280, partial [Spirochaetes bacterium]|nr:hypothetical protein [Spirochaetota bacterium]